MQFRGCLIQNTALSWRNYRQHRMICRPEVFMPDFISPVRIGIVGLGNMGAIHAGYLVDGLVPNAVLSAVCDASTDRLSAFPDAAHFTDSGEMYRSGLIDAVLIAVPHPFHTPLAVAAIEEGLHLLVEKPLGIHKNDCLTTIRAYEKRPRKEQIFGVMFNQRTRPIYAKLKSMIAGGELGEIHRVNWIITDWFRSEAYYKSGGWRATWKGEGGGVMLNQCPHQLDLMAWLFGMPSRVRAFGSLGKYHNIEVEDELTAYLEYPSGATGVFIASTGEAPGTNRLEIAAEMGRIVIENDTVEWMRNEIAASEFSAATDTRLDKPPAKAVEIIIDKQDVPDHVAATRSFVAAIQGKGSFIAHGSEGVNSVELANAMLFSSLRDCTVELPLDGDEYEILLNELIKESKKS